MNCGDGRPLRRHCESPWRRSNPESLRGGTPDCFAALAMMEYVALVQPQSTFEFGCGHTFTFSRHIVPELCVSCRPQKCRGRREGRVPAGTRGPLCANAVEADAQQHTGEAKHPAFPAQWFYGLCRALPGERCTIAPVALRMADVADPVGSHASPQDLTHRPRASGPHDFAVRRLHRSCARGSLLTE